MLALTLCGCANRFTDLPPELQVDQPKICEQVLETVDRPEVTAETDAVTAFLEADNGLYVANERIRAGRACMVDQGQLYAGKGVNP